MNLIPLLFKRFYPVTAVLLLYLFTSPTLAVTPQIAGGGAHSCALSSSGGVKCWGGNRYRQMGDGTSTDRLTPVAVSGLESGVKAVATGWEHSCAIITGGGVKCWGHNNSGQLGDGTGTEPLTPVAVSGLSSVVRAIALGTYHSCALTKGGGVQCWGDNTFGQLGDGTNTNRLTPVAVSGLESGVIAITLGYYHSCALTTAGGVQCWGFNIDGQLGDGTNTNRLTPVAVSGLASGVTAIALGGNHGCALTTAGGIQCWGSNSYGQLGDGTTTNRLTPVAVSGLQSGVTAVDTGGDHSCALTTAGSVQCWGYNWYGQLGDGSSNNSRLTSVAVNGLESGAMAIALGLYHSCALTTAGGVKCWGWNGGYGNLGDGSWGIDRYTPVSVINADSSLLSLFPPPVLSILPIGHGVITSTDDSIFCGSRCSATYNYGGSVTLTAIPSDQRFVFRGWNAHGAKCRANQSTCTLTITDSITVMPIFTWR